MKPAAFDWGDMAIFNFSRRRPSAILGFPI